MLPLQHGIVIWLSGSPELLAGRVVRDGTEGRPLLSQVGPGKRQALARCRGGAACCLPSPRVLDRCARRPALCWSVFVVNGHHAAQGRVMRAKRVSESLLPRCPLCAQGDQAAAAAAADEHAAAVARLTKLLEARRKQYEFSDIEVPLEGEDGEVAGAPVGLVAYRWVAASLSHVCGVLWE